MRNYTAAGAALGQFLRGNLDLDVHTLVFVLIDSADYTPNYATHVTLSDVAGAARVATSGNITPGLSGLVVSQPGFTFTGVTGDQFEQVLVCVRTAVGDANHFLWFMIEDADETELPMTPNGQDIIVAAGNLYTLAT